MIDDVRAVEHWRRTNLARRSRVVHYNLAEDDCDPDGHVSCSVRTSRGAGRRYTDEQRALGNVRTGDPIGQNLLS